MTGYYGDQLAARRLARAYEIAPPRVQQYLSAEIEHVLRKTHPGGRVLELGCGYGRVLAEIAPAVERIVGIDTSLASLRLAGEMLRDVPNCDLALMDAVRLGFADGAFDCVVCIQNGISAFQVDPDVLIREAARVVSDAGTVLFSSYSPRFWKYRLKWFELQAEAGLVGEIDRDQTGNGVIVCKDGFRATSVGPADFLALTEGLGRPVRVVEVDGSSLFCEIGRISAGHGGVRGAGK